MFKTYTGIRTVSTDRVYIHIHYNLYCIDSHLTTPIVDIVYNRYLIESWSTGAESAVNISLYIIQIQIDRDVFNAISL